MTTEDMEDLKADLLDVFENDVEQTIIYRYLTAASETNQQFGFVANQVTADVDLWAVVIENPADKIKKTFGVSGDTALLVYLATKQLDDLGLELKPELGTIVFGGNEYEIEKIQQMPLMSDTSVLTVLLCREAKPNV